MDCSIGQSGNVWFLAGTFTLGATQRSCTLPGGVWLFFPVINAWGDNTGLTEPLTQTVPEMKEAVASLSEPVASSLHVIVDGVAASVTADNRGAAVFQYELPNTDNLLQYFGAQVPGPGWPYGNTPLKTIVAPALSDGYWMMLKPLSAGSHTINFGATAANAGFSLDITYNVTVK